MDVFAHVLWTNLVYFKKYQYKKRQRYIAALFGVLPDLVSFTPAFIFFALTGFHFNPAELLASHNWTLRYAQESYNYTHSLVIFLAALALVTGVRRGKVYWPMLGWALHIAIDIFTHHDFYETPFLFPLSGFKNNFSINWAQPGFMLINYGALAICYLVIFYFRGKKNKA